MQRPCHSLQDAFSVGTQAKLHIAQDCARVEPKLLDRVHQFELFLQPRQIALLLLNCILLGLEPGLFLDRIGLLFENIKSLLLEDSVACRIGGGCLLGLDRLEFSRELCQSRIDRTHRPIPCCGANRSEHTANATEFTERFSPGCGSFFGCFDRLRCHVQQCRDPTLRGVLA